MAFGFGAGALLVEVVIAVLVPLGSVSAPGALPARLAMLIGPALVAVAAGLGGAAGSLVRRDGVMTVAAAALGGALAAEVLDLHVFHLHSEIGLLAVVVIHAPAFVFLAGGLLLHSKLPETVGELTSCDCEVEPSTLSA